MSNNLLELVMIVKNSGDILRKCLNKNKKYIDCWTILDTGSIDNTCEIIQSELKDIPGKLHFTQFTNFKDMRNMAFDLANKSCKYMIVLDDSYEISEGDKLRTFLKNTKYDIINLKIGYFKNFLHNLYYSNRITKTSSNIRYKYRVHEALDIPKKCKQVYMDEKYFFLIDHTNKYHKERTQTRLKKDIEMLLLDKEEYINDSRVLYYITRTYLYISDHKNVLKYAEELLKSTDIEEYKYFAENLIINYKYFDTNDNKQLQKDLLKLQLKHKDRAEPSYKLAVSFYTEGEYNKVNQVMDKLIKVPTPILGMSEIEYDIYEYNIPYLYIEIKFKLGLFDEGIPILKKMLTNYPYDQKLLNMKYAVCKEETKTIKFDKKTIVIHTGDISFYWDPKSKKNISGSEHMAMYLAEEFTYLGYRVFIFGNFDDDINNVNYETTINNVQYIDYTYFSNFCLNYEIDYLIISRFLSNLSYYDNIKNVYLWVHDVLPVGDNKFIQLHQEKFKKIICISEWQKQNIIKNINFPNNLIYLSRNAIRPNRFLMNKDIIKTPFRFIYTSDPIRGLSNFLDMIEPLKKRYPQSSFYIFGKYNQISDMMMKKIKDCDYIFLHPRISQDELVVELQKSDVWLYPTCFEETYCISSVEAMASKCLIATIKLAALTEIIGNRGIITDSYETLFDELCKVLDDKEKKEEIIERGYEWALKQDFYNLALDWKNNLFDK
jgi:hypothetical protein